jgi:UDP-N-acetylglucosamine 4,6-dehydratase
MFNKKKILVTGGTGTFGKYFIRYVLNKYNPKKLIVFSRDEFKQFNFIEELKGHKRFKSMRFLIGDVRDYDRLNFAFKDLDFVIHSAAMKQIPSTEKEPLECIKTNIIGGENVIRASINNKIKKVLALSTDKAVNPINLYGASKLAADKLFISANLLSGSIKTKFSIVRYGNVINSRGSVIPFFLDLKKKGATILPITDTRMTRFFITQDQAIKFVIKSLKLMKGGEIFIPKIPSIRIADLAEVINPKAKLKVIGIRMGEKLHESLFSHEECHLVKEFKDHYILNSLKSNGNLNIKNFLSYDYNSKTNKNFLNKKQISKLI